MSTSEGSSNTADEPRGDGVAEAASAVPENERAVRAEIERTRQLLAVTAEQLVAKTDLKAQARSKATSVVQLLKRRLARLRALAAVRTDAGRSQVAVAAQAARHRTAAAGTTVSGRLQSSLGPAWRKAPEPVRQTAAKGASTMRQRGVPIAAAVVVTALIVLTRRRKR